MAGFQNNPYFKIIGKNKYQLGEDLIYLDENNELYLVPKGFKTDWATIPRFLWFITSPVDDARLSATLHDWNYSLKGSTGISRKKSDELFKESLKYDIPPSPEWKRILMYLTLRLFGSIAWNKK